MREAARTTAANPSGRAQKRYRRFCQTALAVVIFLAALMNGSVSPPYSQMSGVLASLMFLLCLPIRIASPDVRKIAASTALALGLAALWTGLQAVPLPLDYPVHPAWSKMAEALPAAAGYLSVNPALTLSALPALLVPGLIFLTTLILCQSVSVAKRLWVLLSLIGAAIVLLSVLLEAFFPEVQFFSSYRVDFGSFSGVFVNRNVAASFFGLTAFALAGSIQILNPGKRRQQTARQVRPLLLKVFLGALLFAAVIAILATRSRAGSLLSLPLLCLCIALGVAKTRNSWSRSRVLAVLGSGIAFLILFGEPVFSRLGGALQDLRWCAWGSTVAAIQDNPWTGTGFATFADVFPSYRDATCLGIESTWLRAHNSFLELALGLGLPAALLLLATGYWILLKNSLIGLRRRKSLRAIPILTLGALGFVSAHSMVDFPLQIPGVAYYFAALLGAGCAISVLERDPRRHGNRAAQPSTPLFRTIRGSKPS